MGYYGIGVWHPKHEVNVGTLWRTAYAFGAGFVFTVGRRYSPQATDVVKSHRQLPTFSFTSLEDLVSHLPFGCPLVGVELHEDATDLSRFLHPAQACYLLGAEDHGLTGEVLRRCHHTVQIDNLNTCLNVATAGALVMYDRRNQKTGDKTRLREP